MKLRNLHRLLEDFQQAFSDFSLDSESLEYIRRYSEQAGGPSAEIDFDHFVSLLGLLRNGAPDSPGMHVHRESPFKMTFL